MSEIRNNFKVELLGKKLGRLTILELSHNKRFSNYWKCICDCGNEIIVSRSSLTRIKEPTRSCGCLQRDVAKENVKKAHSTTRLPPGEANFNKLYYSYKNNAKKCGREFSLEREEFRKITKQSCFYCGTPPSQKMNAHSGTNGSYFYNGIDRVENDQGYIKGNVVACCFECNRSKHSRNQEEFIQWIEKTYHHLFG